MRFEDADPDEILVMVGKQLQQVRNEDQSFSVLISFALALTMEKVADELGLLRRAIDELRVETVKGLRNIEISLDEHLSP